MSFLDGALSGGIGEDLILELIEALGLNDSSVGGKFDKTYVSGYEYYAGLHLGVCHGPVDEVSAIYFDGKAGWRGSARPGEETLDNPAFAMPTRGEMPEPKDQEDPLDVEDGGAKFLDPADRIDTIVINQGELFGGEPVEGGVLGIINVLHGGRNQPIHSYLAGPIRYDPNSTKIYTPGYRGVLSLVLHSHLKSFKNYIPRGPWWEGVFGEIMAQNRVAKLSEPVTTHTGFYWGAMRPGLRAVSVEGFRALRGWNTNGASADTPWYPTGNDGKPRAIVTRGGKRFMNAIHIIVQSLTDLRFGMKLPIDKIGLSFYAAADQLMETETYLEETDETVQNFYTDQYGISHPCEGFGLGIIWTGETSIREFIQEICRYINGSVYLDPTTGKMEISLVRPVPEQTTVYEQLPIFGPDQIIDIGTFSRPTGEEAINTINLIYSHYTKDKTSTVTRSNTAMVSIYDGQVISETLHFVGIKDSTLAAEVCEREVRQRCSLAATYSRMRVTRESPMMGDIDNPVPAYLRSAMTLYEGAPIRLKWPNHGINGQIFRVANINYGTLEENFVEFDAVEDVFALVDGSQVSESGGYDYPDGGDPLPAFTLDQIRFIDLPYITLISVGGTPLVNALPTDAGLYAVMANTTAQSVTGFKLYTNLSGIEDAYDDVDPATLVASSALTPTSELDGDLAILDPLTGELEKKVRIKNLIRTDAFSLPGAWFIVNDEKMLCVDIVQDEQDPDYLVMTVLRGIFDSVPSAHSDGDTVWWFNGVSAARSSSFRYSSEEPITPYFHVCPYDSSGGSTLGTTSDIKFSHAVDNSWYRPYPPANVKINGELLGSNILGKEFTVEWSCRNRVDQSDVPLSWDAEGVEAEPGTTFTVKVFNGDTNALIYQKAGIETYGPTGYFKFSEPNSASSYKVEIFATRSGVTSAASVIHHISGTTGYGLGYGENYSGAEAGVFLLHGQTPPPVTVLPAVGTPTPRPVWAAGMWAHFDAAVTDDGGKGYLGEPEEIYDFYSTGVSSQFEGPVVTTALGKPYKVRLCCAKGVGVAATVVATDGVSIFVKAGALSTWTAVSKPTVGLFSSPGTVNFISYHQATDQFTVVMNGGADIYTTQDFVSYVRKGTSGEANEVSDSLQVKWVRRFGANYVACGILLADYTKVGVYSSTDLISWTERNVNAPSSAVNPDNWVWYETTDKWYVFSTVGDPSSGAVYGFSTTNGWTFSSKSLGAPIHTPVIGHGFSYGTNPGRVMEVFAGAYVFKTTNGTAWTKQRAKFAPEQILAACHGKIPFEDTDPGTVGSGLFSKGLLLRTGRYLFSPDVPEGHPGAVHQGAVMSLPSFTSAFSLGTVPALVQPLTLPHGNRVGCLGDMSSAVSDAGFFNGGIASDDVYGVFGMSSGSKYFEVSVAASGPVAIGVVAALGPEEPAPVSSLLMGNSGKIYTDARLACPGGITGGEIYKFSNAPRLAQTVVGIHLDIGGGVARAYVNGELISEVTGLISGVVWFPVFSSSATPLRVNLGQTSFLMPTPAGSSAWLS